MIIQKLSDGSFRQKDVMKKIGNSKFYYSQPNEKPRKEAFYEVYSDGSNFSFVIKADGKNIKSPKFKTEELMNRGLTQAQLKLMREHKIKHAKQQDYNSAKYKTTKGGTPEAVEIQKEILADFLKELKRYGQKVTKISKGLQAKKLNTADVIYHLNKIKSLN